MQIDLNNIDDIIIPDEPINPPANEPGEDTLGTGDDFDVDDSGAEGKQATGFNPDFGSASDDDLLDEKKPDAPLGPDDAVEVFTGLASILKDKGFFAHMEDVSTIKDEESLANAFDEEVRSRLTDRQRELMEYMNAGVPLTKITQIQNAIQETEAITPEVLKATEGLSEKLIKADLKFRGYADADAERLYGMIKSSGQEDIEAINTLNARKVNLKGLLSQEIQAAKDAATQENQKKINEAKELEKKLESTEVFGRKVSSVSIEKLKVLANTPVAYTQNGEPLNAVMKYKLDNPVDFEHKLLYLFSATNGFKDLSSFDRSAETRVSRSMRDAVSRLSTGTGIAHRSPADRTGVRINMEQIDDIV
jgi:hypothetical protein